jgi:hypothetical protein
MIFSTKVGVNVERMMSIVKGGYILIISSRQGSVYIERIRSREGCIYVERIRIRQ